MRKPEADPAKKKAKLSRIEALKVEAVSLRRQMCHYPKNPYCSTCTRAKMRPKLARRNRGIGPPPEHFGEQVTADHIISRSKWSEGITGDLDAVLIYDRATRWVDSYPVRSKSADDAYNRFQDFTGSKQCLEYVYVDDSRELSAALDQLGIPNDSATPGRPRTSTGRSQPRAQETKTDDQQPVTFR